MNGYAAMLLINSGLHCSPLSWEVASSPSVE